MERLRTYSLASEVQGAIDIDLAELRQRVSNLVAHHVNAGGSMDDHLHALQHRLPCSIRRDICNLGMSDTSRQTGIRAARHHNQVKSRLGG